MSRKGDLDAFSERIGHTFSDASLLEEALTHGSFNSAVKRDNQRLEFLGDRVLGLAVAERLLADHADTAEGVLAPWLNALVRKETCAEVAAEVGLGAVLQMGRSEQQSGGRRKTAILGDAMEAVIAAVYLDAGYERARDMIHTLWAVKFANVHNLAGDAKSKLQEWAQARGLERPFYAEKSRKGPDHAPLFVVEVQLEGGLSATAEARSKRAAQQEAARMLLEELEAGS